LSETLTIRNFGPIKDIELDLRKFNVIIGEKATGKSTVAKVLAVCRYFSYILPEDNYSPQKESQFNDGLGLWGLDKFIKPNSYIKYDCRHYTLVAKNILVPEIETVYNEEKDEQEQIEIEGYVFIPELTGKSPEFIALLSDLDKLKPQKKSIFDNLAFDSLDWTIPSFFFTNDVAKIMDNPFYLPTERGLQSIFSLGKSSIRNLTDSLFNQFAELDQITKRFTTDTNIEPFNITYKNVNGKGVFKINGETEFFDLDRAASGYQSTIPVVLLISGLTNV